MSRIIQLSTISALMAGCFNQEFSLPDACQEHGFGLGCSANINGELTIYNGKVYEATAGESLHLLADNDKIPFIQVTRFQPEYQQPVENISHENIEQCIKNSLNINNIFLAVCVEGHFEKVVIRRPQREPAQTRSVNQIAAAQRIDTLENKQGKLIGFWTPEIFSRISVPGFHFHFLDQSQQISGHVLAFSATQAIMRFEEKPTIEITNPTSDVYKNTAIDLKSMDEMIQRIEK